MSTPSPNIISLRFPQTSIIDRAGNLSLEWQQWFLYLQNTLIALATGNQQIVNPPGGTMDGQSIDGIDGQDGWSIPGPQGIQGGQGAPGMDGQDAGGDATCYMLQMGPALVTGLYAPGSFTIPTGSYSVMSARLQLSGAQRGTVQGTGRLRIT